MNYDQACNALLSGVYEEIVYGVEKSPVLVNRDGCVVQKDVELPWDCDCGCKVCYNNLWKPL